MIRERIALIVFAGALYSPVHSDIYRWDTGQLIPGTEGITPGPGAQLDRRFLEFANLSQQDLSRATFAWSNLTDASFIESPLTATDFTNARIVGARFSRRLTKKPVSRLGGSCLGSFESLHNG
jgi:hypothetical protein